MACLARTASTVGLFCGVRAARNPIAIQRASVVVVYHPKKNPAVIPNTRGSPVASERYAQELTAFLARIKLNEFKNKDLLLQALTHVSANSSANNNRLSAYGSAIIELTATEIVYLNYPNLPNRSIRTLSQYLNSPEALVKAAQACGVDVLVQSNLKPEGDRNAVIGDGFRSLIAAVAMDKSLKTAQQLARDFLLPVLKQTDIVAHLNLQSPHFTLGRILEAQGLPAAECKMIAETGRKTHLPTFVMGVYSGDKKLGEGAGFSIDMAKSEALKNVLKQHYAQQLRDLKVPEDEDLRAYVIGEKAE